MVKFLYTSLRLFRSEHSSSFHVLSSVYNLPHPEGRGFKDLDGKLSYFKLRY